MTLAEFIAALTDEVVQAMYTSLLSQLERAGELSRIADLPPDQLDAQQRHLQFLLSEGIPRVFLDSGEVHAKVRLTAMKTRRTQRCMIGTSNVAIQVDTVAKPSDTRGYTDIVLRFSTK